MLNQTISFLSQFFKVRSLFLINWLVYNLNIRDEYGQKEVHALSEYISHSCKSFEKNNMVGASKERCLHN